MKARCFCSISKFPIIKKHKTYLCCKGKNPGYTTISSHFLVGVGQFLQRVSRFPWCAGERRQNTAREVKQNAAGRSEAFSCPAGREIWLKVEAEPEFPRSTGIVWQDPTSPATASARSPQRDLPNPTCAWGKLFPDDAWL